MLVVRQDGTVYGASYKWRPNDAEADLVLDGLEEEIEVTSEDGEPSVQKWYFPSPSDCLSCHTPEVGFVLAVKPMQLDRDAYYPSTGRVADQISTWRHLGMFSFDDAFEQPPELARIGDSSAGMGPLGWEFS